MDTKQEISKVLQDQKVYVRTTVDLLYLGTLCYIEGNTCLLREAVRVIINQPTDGRPLPCNVIEEASYVYLANVAEIYIAAS